MGSLSEVERYFTEACRFFPERGVGEDGKPAKCGWHELCASGERGVQLRRSEAMHATAKFSAIQPLFRRACTLVAPVLRYVGTHRSAQPELEAWSPDCDAGDSPFRVTNRRRRWTRVRHFMDVGTALHHAIANDGVVWERYVGPTGAVNWWSLTEAECEAMLAAAPAAAEAAGAMS